MIKMYLMLFFWHIDQIVKPLKVKAMCISNCWVGSIYVQIKF